MEKYIAGKRSMECKQKQLGGLVRNKIKHRTKYKIGKSPTPEGKISIVLFTRLAELGNDCNLTQGCRRFPYLVLFPVFDSINLTHGLRHNCAIDQSATENKVIHALIIDFFSHGLRSVKIEQELENK